jgi:hypothetical protein
MDWLASNWIWLLLALGAFALVARGGHGCGMGHGGHDHHKRSDGKDAQGRPGDTTAAKSRSDDRTRASVGHTHG